MKSKFPQGNPADDSGQHATPEVGGVKDQSALPAQGSPIEQAELRTKEANLRTDQANTRTVEANTRTAEANTRTEQANLRTKKTLRASEERYKALFDRSLDCVFLTDFDGKFLDANQAALDLLGLQHKELSSLTFASLLTADQLPGAFQTVEEIKATGRQQHLTEYRVHCKDGREVYVETQSSLIHREGKPFAILGIARDITERKAAEMGMSRLGAIVESSDDAIFSTDLNSVITSWNKGAEKIFGYTATDMVGTSNMRLIPTDRPEELNQILEEIKGGEHAGHLETLRQTKDGRLVDVSITASPIKDATGKIVGVSKILRDITDRKRTEAVLLASETEFRAMFELASIGIAQADPHTLRWLRVNQTMCAITGYSADELLRMQITDITHPEDRQQDEEAFQRVVRGEQPNYRMEKRYRRKDGTEAWVNVNMTILRNPAGQPIRTMATIEDITERRAVDAALRKSEAKYRNLFECSRDALLRLDPVSRRFTSCNPSAVRMFGAKNEAELIGHGPEEFSPERQPDGCLSVEKVREIDEIILRKGAHFFEWTHRRISGEEFHADVLLTRIEMDGIPIILATVRDITERKREEESHARLAMAVEQAAETIVITDAGGTILYANPAFEKSTGYTRAEALGQNPRVLKSGKQDAAFYRRMWETIEHGEIWSGHFINKRKDGTLYEEEATISPIRDATGKIINFVAVKRDVTHEVELAGQLRQSQKMEAIGTLAGGVAHDFNNILAIISMQASLLKGGGGLSAAQLKFADEIGTTVDRAAALTRQLLLFSHREALQLRDLDWSEAVTNTTKMLRRILGENIKVQLNLEAESMFIHADAGMMDQVLLNLAVNARDAMPKGGQLIISTAGVEFDKFAAAQSPPARPGAFVCLSVSDNGSGIPPEVLPKIFEPFFTTKGVGKGTGLGLATVFGIVQQHHGWINVNSELGQGTTFKVYLPRLIGMSDKLIAQKMLATVPTGKETILLVEDEPALLTSVQITLTQLGYHVLVAPTGPKALEVWKEHRAEIRLLLTDLMMPDGMTGRELAHRLLKKNLKLKVIYMSGYSADSVDKDFPMQEGVNFLTKPFPTHILAQTIRDTLDKPA